MATACMGLACYANGDSATQVILSLHSHAHRSGTRPIYIKILGNYNLVALYIHASYNIICI